MSFQAFPPLRRHRASGRAVVTVRISNGSRKDFYCGPWRSAEAAKEYQRICGVLIANGGQWPGSRADASVNEGILAYVKHVTAYYPESSSEVFTIKTAMRAVRRLYGSENLTSFGPVALQALQLAWVGEGITRGGVNRRTGVVKRWAKWLVSQEHVSADFHQRLITVEGLRAGKTTAPDNPPVQPADPEHVAKALEHLPPDLAALCRLQTLCGSRCGELLRMRPADVDRTGAVWSYSPSSHKGTWRGKARTIYFGPEAQQILSPLLHKAGSGFVFSPVRVEASRHAVRSENRKTPRYPSHMKRNNTVRVKTRKRPPRECYDTCAVRHALTRACLKAGVPPFSPHRLRHLAAVTIRNEFGLEHARAALGHTDEAMTMHYSRAAEGKLASEVMRKIG